MDIFSESGHRCLPPCSRKHSRSPLAGPLDLPSPEIAKTNGYNVIYIYIYIVYNVIIVKSCKVSLYTVF